MNFAQLLFYFNNQPGNQSSLCVAFFSYIFFAVLVLFSPAGTFPLQHDAVQCTNKYKKNHGQVVYCLEKNNIHLFHCS